MGTNRWPRQRRIPYGRLMLVVALTTTNPGGRSPGRNPKNEPSRRCPQCGWLARWNAATSRWVCRNNSNHEVPGNPGQA